MYHCMDKSLLENQINSGLSHYQIAKNLKKSNGSIQYWLKKFNLKTQCFQIGKVPKKEKIINWSELQKDHDGGMIQVELRKKYHLNHKELKNASLKGIIKLRDYSTSSKLSHKTGKVDYSVYRTDEFRNKMRQYGGLKNNNNGRVKGRFYQKKDGTKCFLQGSWEWKFAEFLDYKNVVWVKNKVGYKYEFCGKIHNYFPDFYLTEFDLFVEIKGYERDRDKAKWSQFPFKLSIIKKNEIHNLENWYSKNFKMLP